MVREGSAPLLRLQETIEQALASEPEMALTVILMRIMKGAEAERQTRK